MKVVINNCYGGFGLSKKAVLRYHELAGKRIYSEQDSTVTHYYYVPVEEAEKLRKEALATKNYMPFNAVYFHDSSLERNDPILVQVVEELGEDASAEYAELKVVEIPDNVNWKIEDYDGNEHVAEWHRTWS